MLKRFVRSQAEEAKTVNQNAMDKENDNEPEYAQYLTSEEIAALQMEMPEKDTMEYHKWIRETIFGRFNKKKDWNKGLSFLHWFGDKWDLNYKKYASQGPATYDIILHRMFPLLRYVLSHYPQFNSDVTSTDVKTVLDEALRVRNDKAINMLINHKKPKEIEKLEAEGEEYHEFLSKYEVLMKYLEKTIDTMQINITIEEIMYILSVTMQELIKNKMPLFHDMLFVVLTYESSQQQQQQQQQQNKKYSSLEEIMTKDIRTFINSETLSKSVADYLYLQENILNNKGMILPSSCTPLEYKNDTTRIIGDVIQEMANLEIEKASNQLQEKMKELILNDYQMWTNLCQTDYTYLNKKEWRQDQIANGIKPRITKANLEWMNLHAQDEKFSAENFYDYHVYLSELVARAHLMSNSFEELLTYIYEDYPSVHLMFDALKSINEYIVKGEAKQTNKENMIWPKCAEIIDILRCSIICNNASDCISCIHRMFSYIESDENIYNNKYQIKEIVRIKNSFFEKHVQDIFLEEKPLNEYTDVTMNVVLNKRQKNSWIAMVVEIHFILPPIRDFKLKTYRIGKILRFTTFLKKLQQIVMKKSLLYDACAAGVNESNLGALLIKYPLHFLENRDNILFEPIGGTLVCHQFIWLNDSEVLRTFLKNNKYAHAFLTTPNERGETSFYSLVGYNSEKSVAEMWLSTIEVGKMHEVWQQKNQYGNTPFHDFVEWQGDKSVAELWLNTIDKEKIGEMWECLNDFGETPVHYLVKDQVGEDMIELFLHHIPVDMIEDLFRIRNTWNKTPLEMHRFLPEDKILMRRYQRMVKWLRNDEKRSVSKNESDGEESSDYSQEESIEKYNETESDEEKEENGEDLDTLVSTWLHLEQMYERKDEKTTHRYWFIKMLQWYQQKKQYGKIIKAT